MNKRAECGCDVSTLHQTAIEEAGPHQLAILYSYDHNGWGTLKVADADGENLLWAAIDSHSRYRRFMFKARKPGPVRITYSHIGGSGRLTCHALGVQNIIVAPNHSHAPIRANSVCAAIATYPQRRAMLGDTVASLVPQVDYVFVYLNNYTSVPELHLPEKLRRKVQFILDTNSGYRAAAKFAWLDRHKCYWLICDDDIIYSHDYASSMLAQVRRHGDRAIIGVHATIFDRHAAAGRRELPFQFELKTDERVHMLGTGTIALHSSALPRESVIVCCDTRSKTTRFSRFCAGVSGSPKLPCSVGRSG